MNIVDKVVFIPICCVCDRVRDDQQTSGTPTSRGLEQWTSLTSFLRLYRIPQDAYKLTHTYCSRCMEHLGFNQKKSDQRETIQEDIRRRIISVIESAIECDLDTLVSRCGDLSWGQIFLEVDNMSRIGAVLLTRSANGRYCLGLPSLAPSDGTPLKTHGDTTMVAQCLAKL
jgi:hypothetical protein